MTIKYILIASNGPKAGKSVLTDTLVSLFNSNAPESSYNAFKHSFAAAIRDDVFYLIDKYTSYSVSELHKQYRQLKDKEVEYSSELEACFDIRTLLNKYSLLMKEFFKGPIWGSKFYQTSLLFSEANKQNICICDDWRGHEESDFLIQKVGKENVLTIHIHNDDVISPTETSFEGNISPDQCDLAFDFSNQWASFDAAVQQILTSATSK